MIIKVKDHLKCQICNEEFTNTVHRNRHIRQVHKLTIDEYAIKCYLNNIAPTCKCGCGTKVKVKFFKDEIRINDYTTNHFPREPHTEEAKEKIREGCKRTFLEKYGVENIYMTKFCVQKIEKTKLERYGDTKYNNPKKVKQTKLERHGDENYMNKDKLIETNQERYGANSFTATDKGKQKIKQTNLERYGDENYVNMEKIAKTKLERYGYECEYGDPVFRAKYNVKTSKIEKEVCEKLNGQSKFIYENKEFDIKLDNDIFEIDGDFWHPSSLNKLTISQIGSVINDKKKIKSIKDSKYDLYKIHISELPKEINATNLKNNSYIPDYSITYYQKIMTKEYFKRYLEKKKEKKLKGFAPLLLKFIRAFHPKFPYLEQKENLQEVIKKISQYDLNRIKINDKTYSNNCSVLGVNYLKSNFKSYWNSKFERNKYTPVEAWNDDKLMIKVIEYRIGINNSNEIFDFSLHQLIRGLSARRFTISFFKPILAAAIYHDLLKDKENPIVIDPCAGFGGRLLGFKSIYPNGTYIGIESNIDTYKELKKLVKNAKFSNVKLYNCKFEDFENIYDYDLIFTSIPYFNVETYSNNITYNNFDQWREIFFNQFFKYNNVYLNMSYKLYEELNLNSKQLFNITSNTSHYNQSKSRKNEIITKLQ